MKKRVVGFFSVVFLLILIGILFFSGIINITGRVTQLYSPSDCSEVEIFKVWDEIFDEDSSGATALWDESYSGVGCGDYYAYKVAGTAVWALTNNQMNYYGKENINLSGYYVNSTLSTALAIGNFSEFDPVDMAYLDSLYSTGSLIEDRVVAFDHVGNGSDEFPKYFSIVDGCSWTNPGLDGLISCFSELLNSWGWTEIEEWLLVHKTEQGSFYKIDFENSSGCGTPIFAEDISNLSVERNSSNNVIVDLDDYFNYSYGYEVSVATNQSGFSISDVGVLSFTPTTGFLGSVSVIIEGKNCTESAFSNEIYITVVEDLNFLPTLRKDILDVFLIQGDNETIWMDVYFEDPEEDNMTYSVSTLEHFVVTIEEDRIIIGLEENYSGFERAWIYAHDGTNSTKSNQFYVVADLDISTFTGEGDQGNSSSQNSSSSQNTSLDAGNGSSSGNQTRSVGDEEGEGSYLWIFLLIGVVVLVIGVLIFVYFLIIRKERVIVSKEIEPQIQQSRVTDYMKKLGIKRS
jgi:hypothetical protein